MNKIEREIERWKTIDRIEEKLDKLLKFHDIKIEQEEAVSDEPKEE